MSTRVWKKQKSGRAIVAIDNSKESIRRDVFESLKRLDLEILPMVFIHKKDENISLTESLDCLSQLQQEGYIRHIGLSNHDISDIKFARDKYQIYACQFELSIIHSENKEIVDFCKDHGIRVMTFSSLARGILTEKYINGFRKFSSNDRRSKLHSFTKSFYERNHQKLESLSMLANRYGYNISSMSLRWALDIAKSDYCLVGCKNIDQFKEIEPAISSEMPLNLKDELIYEINGETYE